MKYEALEGLKTKSNPLNTCSYGTRQKASVGYNKNHKGNAPWIIAEFTTWLCISIQLLTYGITFDATAGVVDCRIFYGQDECVSVWRAFAYLLCII
jgi:hypothetical protein